VAGSSELTSRDRMEMQTVLRQTGTGMLWIAAVMLIGVLIIANQSGAVALPGMLAGSVIGTAFILATPGRPTRLGVRHQPRQLSRFEQRLD